MNSLYSKTLVLVGVLALIAALTAVFFSLDRLAAARDRQDAPAPAEHATAEQSALGIESFAGVTAEDAAETAHKPFPARLGPAPSGPVARVRITLKDITTEIAPGVKYRAWGFDAGAPGPVVHVREGQKVEITLTNGGAIPHSIDFHSARIAPNKAFVDVQPGKSITYSFIAKDPGVYMYHCGTKPVLAHIANGMYGAIVVDPAKPLPHADQEYVLVSSEWYLTRPGTSEPASFDMDKAHAVMPDWVTWNGYAAQYVEHPLTADPGDTVRFYVVAAGPSLDTDFHVVGTIFDRAYVDGDVTSPPLRGVQTVSVPAGGGAIFDMKIDEPGLYPFVSHSFASVDMGQVGLLKVGNVHGSTSH